MQNGVEHFIVYLYDESGAPIGMQYRTSDYAWDEFDNYFFEKNLFGDVVAVYNEAGTKIGSYTYDAWGICTTSVQSTASAAENKIVRQFNPFRYRGYFYDYDTGLYYLQSRYYNPQWGRFLNADGYVNANGDLVGFNMYAYCSNNPVMYTDPTGESVILTAILIGCAVGAVVGGIIGGTIAYNSAKESGAEGEDLFWATAAGVGTGALIGGIAGGLIGATGGVLGTVASASTLGGTLTVAGSTMLVSTATLGLKATEIAALQWRESTMNGKSHWQAANDCMNSIYGNGLAIMSYGVKKTGTTTAGYASAAFVSAHHTKSAAYSLSITSYLSSCSPLGATLSYLSLAPTVYNTANAFFCDDPCATAQKRGYVLQ